MRSDVVVVGAGVIGASIAHQLTRRGVSVTVVDQAAHCGAGATRFSGGMVRAYDPDPAIQELAIASLAVYRDPAQWAAEQSPLHAVGALTIANADEEHSWREAAQRINTELDASAQVVTDRDEALGVSLADGIALVEPGAGWVSPTSVTTDWLHQAASRGASIRYGVRLQRLQIQGGRPVAVTSAGEIHAGAVIVATGPWAAQPIAGLQPNHGVRARSIQVNIMCAPSGGRKYATFIDQRTGVYGKPVDDQHCLVGKPHLLWDVPVDSPPDQAHAQATSHAAYTYLPWLREAHLYQVIRATDGYSAHSTALNGTNLPHVWVARSGNGCGVRTAPETGRRIADLCMTQTFATSS